MAWFSSGFSNLKEQLNSLISDDDDIGNNSCSRADSMMTDTGSRGERLLRNVKNDVETSEQDETSLQSRFSYTQRHRVLQYSKMLSDLTNDVNILNSSLDQVLGDVVNCIDENERLHEQINIRKDGNAYRTDLLIDKMRTDKVAAAEKQDGNFGYNIECGEKIVDNRCDNLLTTNESSANEVYERHCKTAATNKEVNAVATMAAATALMSAVGDDSEITEKIENLTIEMDKINEKLKQWERSWSKVTNDGIPPNMFADYATLARRRDVLWEKLKVLFIWPTIGKFKNANISELSVPDSVKEVFQPAVFLVRSNDKALRQLALSEATAAQSPDVQESTIAIHHPPVPSPPPCLENYGASVTIAAAAQKDKKFIESELNKSPPTTDAAIVEINRLRTHLVSVEQAYTNELLQCEEEIKILQSELKIKEEKLNSIAASYTSANLSTNKALERLQLEIQQLSNENQQLTCQLYRCHQDLEESHTDTRNLRSALDFFRQNKDSEIYQVTEKIKSEIQTLQNENECLRESLASLQNDLDDSQQIFRKNEILSEELKTKLDEIDTLRRKVDELLRRQGFQNTNTPEEGSERTLEVARSTSTLDVEAKMRLNLIKNVAFRYLTSDAPTTKSQSLRILADVLEFSDCEKMKIGIRATATAAAAIWSSEKTKNNQSLIDEFIRFVEKESHPQTIQAQVEPHQPMQKRIRSAASSSDADAVISTNIPASMNLPPARNLTSCSILLKDVLNSKDI